MSGDRRLAIASLLNDDSDPSSNAPYSPLEALVHAATEERRRMAYPIHPQHYLPQDDHPRPQLPPPLPPDQQPDRRRPRAPSHADLTHFQRPDGSPRVTTVPRPQDFQRQHHQHQIQQLLQSPTSHRLDERRPFDPLERQVDPRQAEHNRQQQALRQQQQMLLDRERRQREQEMFEAERQRLLEERQREERQREYEQGVQARQREHRQQQQQQLLQQQQQLQLRQLQQQQQQQRELERQRNLELQRERDMAVLRERERQAELDRQRFQQQQQQLQQQPRRFSDPQRISLQPHPPTASHSASISHLISQSPPPSVQKHVSASPISPDPPPQFTDHDDLRPTKKPRFSQSPTRPVSDDKDRIARERDRMFVGEIGYGRVDPPSSIPPPPPRRPGSGQSSIRKPGLSDLLVDKDHPPVPPKPEFHRVVSPLGRRSPPGSQIGRAKAARKSDEHLRDQPLPSPVVRPKEEPSPFPLPARRRSATVDEPAPPLVVTTVPSPKRKEHPPSPSPMTRPSVKLQHHDPDPHDWLLQQFSDPVPRRPETSAAPFPPPSQSPPARRESPLPVTKPHRSVAAIDDLEKELEAFVSPQAPLGNQQELPPAPAMDLDVDQEVAKLVAETEDDVHIKREPSRIGMEVDVEDELLSLVGDKSAPPASPTIARRPTVSHSPALPPPRKQTPPDEAPEPLVPPLALPSSAPSSSVPPLVEPSPDPGPSVSPVVTLAIATETPASDRPATEPAQKKKKKDGSIQKAEGKTKSTNNKVNASTPSAAAAKSRQKTAPKAKKEKAAANTSATTTAADVRASTPTSVPHTAPTKAKAQKKVVASISASRSRSTSARPTGSVEPESATKAEKQEEEEESDTPNEDDKLYCVCKTKYDEGRFMIACDKCDEWYHTQCVDMPDLEVDLVDQFICPPCIAKHPHLNLRTTYKPRCLYGLRYPDPDSSKACHKAARGAISKYCSDECGYKYMQLRIDSYAKKGGKTDKLWDGVKNAEKREGVVQCAVPEEKPVCNGAASAVEDAKEGSEDNEVNGGDGSKLPSPPPLKHRIIQPSKTKAEREKIRLDTLLEENLKSQEELKRDMEVILWREQLLQMASERAEQLGQCGWDGRLCYDEDDWDKKATNVLESYEDWKAGRDVGVMDPDNPEDAWCDVEGCKRHAGWQATRYKDICKEKEKKEDALNKLTERERDLRKRIDALLDPHKATLNEAEPEDSNAAATATAPLRSSNAKLTNGHTKSSKVTTAGDTQKKGKKRKNPT